MDYFITEFKNCTIAIIVFLIFFAIDFIFGLCKGIFIEGVSSTKLRMSVPKFVGYVGMIFMCILLDTLIVSSTNIDYSPIGLISCICFCIIEGSSIIENAKALGIHIPKVITKTIDYIKSKFNPEEKGSGGMSFDEFVKKYLGKKTDYDNVSGVQCVDLAKVYLREVHGIKAGAWGNARDYWMSFSKHPELTANFKKIKNTPDFVPKKGDIVIWSGDISSTNDYGHIAVATGEGNTNTFYTYDQNWGCKEMKKIKHTYFAVYGVLRPINQSMIITPPNVKLGTYTLTNVRGVYKGYGDKSGRKKVKDLTKGGKRSATSTNKNADAYLKSGTAVSILETKLLSSGNLWAKIPSGYICIWECNIDKKFIK